MGVRQLLWGAGVVVVVVVFRRGRTLVVALEDGVGVDAALGMPAVGGADVAVGVGFGDQAIIRMEVECGANAAVRRARLADDLFNATTEGVVGVLGNGVAVVVGRFNQPFG
ncbi:MAG: hypothetical protein ACK45Y_01745 [Betaproteobacteria bacterium]